LNGQFSQVSLPLCDPCLYLDRVDVEVRRINVAGPQAFGRQLARVGPAASFDLIAAAVGQGKRRVPAADGGEVG
jgi:hypothetical protein